MGKRLLLAKSNLRKNRGTTIGLFLLMVLAAALVGVALLMFIDAYPTARKEAKRLNAGDGFLLIAGGAQEVQEAELIEMMGKDVSEYEMERLLGYSTVSLPYAKGNLSVSLLVTDGSSLKRSMERVEIVTEDSTIQGPYLYLPYQFYTGGGYQVGDAYPLELMGVKYSFTIRGFLNSTSFGCNNCGFYEMIVDADTYAALQEHDGEGSNSILVNYKVAKDVKCSKFYLRMGNELYAKYPMVTVFGMDLESTLFNKSFMSLIIAVSFLTVTIVLILVVALMLVNCIANYIRENQRTIGALKALGYTSRDIRGSLYVLFGGIAFVGSLIGICVSYLLMPTMAKLVVSQMGLPYQVSFHALATWLPVAVEVVFVLLFSVLASRKIRRIDPIVALRDGTEAHNFRKNRLSLEKSRVGLNVSLGLKTFFTNWKQNLLTFIVMGFLMFICVISVLMYENFNRKPKLSMFTFETSAGVVAFDADTKAEGYEFLAAVPGVSNIRRMMNLGLIYNGEESLNTNIFDDVSKMNNKEVCYKGRLPKHENEIAVSGKFAKLYGYEIGDEIEMTFGDQSFMYLITGLVQTCNNSGREAVMSEAAAGHLIDLTDREAYYWFDYSDATIAGAQKVLDACGEAYGEHVISQLNFYEIIEGSMTTFKNIAALMLVLMCTIALVVIALILYLLIKAFTYNKRRDYGIYKALGYTSGSLILQTAISFMPSIIASVAIFSVVSYFLANPYMTSIMYNFGLMKCSFDIPVPGVIGVGALLIVASFLFAVFQARRIRKIEPYRMLIGE